MITANQLVAHLVGDYILQSHWMATEKTKKSIAAIAHAISYTAAFLLLTTDWRALAVIASTHFVIDRWRLARFVVWAKNMVGPPSSWHPWPECSATGYHKDVPPWLAVWLLIVADNTMHLICNGLALHYLG